MPTAAKTAVGFAKPGHNHQSCVADAVAAADALCQEKGTRLTSLRKRVLELVWGSHQPIGAYALLDALRKEDLASAPPTVYRALDFLLENGLVHRIESLNAFVGCAHPGDAHRGLFLICKSCRNAVEIEDARISRAIANSAGDRGFAVQQATVEITGICPNCRRAAAE
ncbi:MAG: Fur family transcriptional regulator [Alphaproteobacteria bacterium]|nr:Fur family transcriptional regulator [Alphaproteobacteria bacterium]